MRLLKGIAVSLSILLLSSCSSFNKHKSPFVGGSSVLNNERYVVDNAAKSVSNLLEIDFKEFHFGRQSYINWRDMGLKPGDGSRVVISKFDISDCFQFGCGKDGKLNSLRLYILYYTAKVSGINPWEVESGWWYKGNIINNNTLDLMSDYDLFMYNYNKDYAKFNMPLFSEEDIKAQMKLIHDFAKGIRAGVNRKIDDLNKEKERESLSKPPRMKGEIKTTGKPVVDAIISLINAQNLVIGRNQDDKGRYYGGYYLVKINGRNISGWVDTDKIRESIFNSVFQCQPMGTYISDDWVYNVCVSGIANGTALWVSAINDRDISNKEFNDARIGSPDLGVWALKAYQYKRIR